MIFLSQINQWQYRICLQFLNCLLLEITMGMHLVLVIHFCLDWLVIEALKFVMLMKAEVWVAESLGSRQTDRWLIGQMTIIFKKYFRRKSKIIFKKSFKERVRISQMKILRLALIQQLGLVSFEVISLLRLNRELQVKMVLQIVEMDLPQKIEHLQMRWCLWEWLKIKVWEQQIYR